MIGLFVHERAIYSQLYCSRARIVGVVPVFLLAADISKIKLTYRIYLYYVEDISIESKNKRIRLEVV